MTVPNPSLIALGLILNNFTKLETWSFLYSPSFFRDWSGFTFSDSRGDADQGGYNGGLGALLKLVPAQQLALSH